MNVDIRNKASTYRSSVYDPSNSNNIKIDINIDDIYVDDSIKSDNSIKLISEINNLDELNDSNESSESSESNESINSNDSSPIAISTVSQNNYIVMQKVFQIITLTSIFLKQVLICLTEIWILIK